MTAGLASLAACSTQTSDVASPAACSTEGAETLVRPYTARHWVTQRAVGKGGQGRLESRPQARKPAPQKQLAHKQGPVAKQERKADHRQDCRCGTQDCVLHGEAGMASRAGCSTRTGGVASVAACSTWRRRLGGGEQWVKGAKAGSKACPTSDTTWRARKKQTTARQSRNQTGVAA